MMAVAAIFKMADSGYSYDASLLYWRGMQVDGERLFTNKDPVMVKEVTIFKIACFGVNILRQMSPKGQKLPKTVTI